MTVAEVVELLKQARTPQEVFGADKDKAAKIHIQLQAITHPDRNGGDDVLFKRINVLWEKYNEPPAPPIVSPKRQYQSVDIIGVGDVADVHLCREVVTDPGELPKEYALKISRIPGGEALLKNEAEKVAKVLKEAGDTNYRHYLPTLVESFPAKDAIQKHVNVFVYEDGFYDLEQVHAQHAALDGRHIAWIFKRLLTAIGVAQKAGVTHTAVLPPHIRICPGMPDQKDNKAHALMLVGWGHAVDSGEVTKTISARYRDWYPPEVLAKKTVFAGTDVYMAAKCMVYLAGGDIATGETPGLPKAMGRFLKSLLAEGQLMRPDEPWNLYEDFSDLLKSLYGPPKFHHLAMA